jgi:hypothetical protein
MTSPRNERSHCHVFWKLSSHYSLSLFRLVMCGRTESAERSQGSVAKSRTAIRLEIILFLKQKSLQCDFFLCTLQRNP